MYSGIQICLVQPEWEQEHESEEEAGRKGAVPRRCPSKPRPTSLCRAAAAGTLPLPGDPVHSGRWDLLALPISASFFKVATDPVLGSR